MNILILLLIGLTAFGGIFGMEDDVELIDMSSSGNELTPESTSTDETSPPKDSDSPEQEDTGDCSSDGFFRNKSDCSKFYRCAKGIRYDFNCLAALRFDESLKTCNWPNRVQC